MDPLQYADDLNTSVNPPRFEGGLTKTLNNTSGVSSLIELPDGRLAVGSVDGLIRIWDITRKSHGRIDQVMDLLTHLSRTRRPTQTLIGHTGSVLALLVLPDGRLASGSADGTIRLWDLMHGLYLGEMESHDFSTILEGHTSAVQALVMLPEESEWGTPHSLSSVASRLASGSADGTVRLWDLANGTSQTLIKHQEEVTALVVQQGQLLSGSLDGAIIQWDTNSGLGQTFYVYDHPILSMVVLPRLGLAIGSLFSSIRIISRHNARTYDVRSGIITIASLGVMPNGHLVAGGFNHKISIWNPDTGSVRFLFGIKGGVGALAVLSDGRLAVGSKDGEIYVWE